MYGLGRRRGMRGAPADLSSEDEIGLTYEDLLLLEERNVRRGLTPEQLAALPTRSAVKADLQNTCHICLDGFDYGDHVTELEPCEHTYHMECINKWLSQKRTCPICRHEC